MKQLKNIAAILVLVVAVTPLLMVFNEDSGKMYINVLGIVYGVLLTRYGRRIAPRFVRDYLDSME